MGAGGGGRIICLDGTDDPLLNPAEAWAKTALQGSYLLGSLLMLRLPTSPRHRNSAIQEGLKPQK